MLQAVEVTAQAKDPRPQQSAAAQLLNHPAMDITQASAQGSNLVVASPAATACQLHHQPALCQQPQEQLLQELIRSHRSEMEMLQQAKHADLQQLAKQHAAVMHEVNCKLQLQTAEAEALIAQLQAVKGDVDTPDPLVAAQQLQKALQVRMT